MAKIYKPDSTTLVVIGGCCCRKCVPRPDRLEQCTSDQSLASFRYAMQSMTVGNGECLKLKSPPKPSATSQTPPEA
jgi:hypothetical protein